jgi:hypothetical protein
LSYVASFPNIDDALRAAVRQELCRRGLGFGKFKDVPLPKVPTWYLNWLIGSEFELQPPWDKLVEEELEERGVCIDS